MLLLNHCVQYVSCVTTVIAFCFEVSHGGTQELPDLFLDRVCKICLNQALVSLGLV